MTAGAFRDAAALQLVRGAISGDAKINSVWRVVGEGRCRQRVGGGRLSIYSAPSLRRAARRVYCARYIGAPPQRVPIVNKRRAARAAASRARQRQQHTSHEYCLH